MRGLALGVSIALTAAGAAAAEDLSLPKRTQALRDVVFAAPTAKDWPVKLKLGSERFGVGVAPHLAVGGDSRAEAGAEFRLGLSRRDPVTERLESLGVRDGAHFGQTGRWYLFAAASSRSVGLNMLRSEDGWSQQGWTMDDASALIGDAQAGVAWRRGALQASVGYLHREVKIRNAPIEDDGKTDSLVAFSFSIKP